MILTDTSIKRLVTLFSNVKFKGFTDFFPPTSGGFGEGYGDNDIHYSLVNRILTCRLRDDFLVSVKDCEYVRLEWDGLKQDRERAGNELGPIILHSEWEGHRKILTEYYDQKGFSTKEYPYLYLDVISSAWELWEKLEEIEQMQLSEIELKSKLFKQHIERDKIKESLEKLIASSKEMEP